MLVRAHSTGPWLDLNNEKQAHRPKPTKPLLDLLRRLSIDPNLICTSHNTTHVLSDNRGSPQVVQKVQKNSCFVLKLVI
jgi:hypothetical protein